MGTENTREQLGNVGAASPFVKNAGTEKFYSAIAGIMQSFARRIVFRPRVAEQVYGAGEEVRQRRGHIVAMVTQRGNFLER